MAQNEQMKRSLTNKFQLPDDFIFYRSFGPKQALVYPFGVPLSTWFSGYIRTLRETEGHKNRPIFIGVYEFVQEKRKLRTALEANALIH